MRWDWAKTLINSSGVQPTHYNSISEWLLFQTQNTIPKISRSAPTPSHFIADFICISFFNLLCVHRPGIPFSSVCHLGISYLPFKNQLLSYLHVKIFCLTCPACIDPQTHFFIILTLKTIESLNLNNVSNIILCNAPILQIRKQLTFQALW